MNAAMKLTNELRDGNYVLRPNPDHHYWANISAGRLAGLVARRSEMFNLVIVGSPENEGDFYAIPYLAIKHALQEEFRSTDRTGRARWVARIRNHQLRIGRYPVPIDVGRFFGSQAVLARPGLLDSETGADQNDYAIENRKIEIAQRQKQSLFRDRVLRNFEGRCCLSGICEDALLVASHIVPWAKRINTRLDPANGLLLFCSYDRLFDAGYISFDDELRVLVSSTIVRCSSALRTLVEEVAGRQARLPVKWPIRPDYLAYHRTEVLRAANCAGGSDESEL